MASDTKWYYSDATGSAQGPHSPADLRALHESGTINAGTYLWSEGRAEWMPLQDISELKEVAASSVQQPETSADDELARWQAEMEKEGAYDDDPQPSAAADVPASPEEKSFVDDDGMTYEWDPVMRKFLPKDQGEAPRGAQPAGSVSASASVKKKPVSSLEYSAEDMTFEAEDEVLPTITKDGKILDREFKKRQAPDAEKLEAAIEREKEKQEKKKEQKQDKKGWFDLKNNTSVYITGLPLDVDEYEVADEFGKCGIIKDDAEGKPRVKLYRDKASGALKGDALVTFLRLPSVEIAVNVLDGCHFRPGCSEVMTVSGAKFEQKGEYVERAQTSKKQKKQRLQKQEKDLGWGGFDDQVKKERLTVILKHMFTVEEVQREGPHFVADLEADIAEECCKIGPVTRLKMFAGNPEGVVSIQFKTEDAAQECIQKMHGRWFGGQQVQAGIYDGHTNYYVELKESEEQQAARLERFSKELEE